MSVNNYHYSLSNNPEERSSDLPRGGSLQSRKTSAVGTNPAHYVTLYISGYINMVPHPFSPTRVISGGGSGPLNKPHA